LTVKKLFLSIPVKFSHHFHYFLTLFSYLISYLISPIFLLPFEKKVNVFLCFPRFCTVFFRFVL